MIGTSIWEYILIRTCIFFLHLIAPFSTFYSLARSLVHLPYSLPGILEAWLALEAVFYIAVYLPRRVYLQRAAVSTTTVSHDNRRMIFGAAMTTSQTRTGIWRNGRKLEPGRGKAKCLRLTYDKVEMLHRSLKWYLCVFAVDTYMSCYLRYHSFNFHRASLLQSLAVFPIRPLTLFTTHCASAKTVTYWHRPHTSETRLPILFVHGLGVGLYPYVEFLVELNDGSGEDALDGQLGIIAVEIMPVSCRITSEALLKDRMCEEVHQILEAHGWDKFVLIYRKPTRANEHQLSYFASKDMGISHKLFRRFYWADNILWKEDIQNHQVAVALAGKDLIVDTKAIGAYLTGANDWTLETGGWKDGVLKGIGLNVLWFQELDHGQVFDRKRARMKLVEVVRSCKIRGQQLLLSKPI
ncbi:hypothetical protein GE09DRAFT_1208261 [Coniochaeta sp. 2T2.1]|nr:hypothetical protein GE09DRAFT_1208261 [Coniochaeta sp. 2T2.1]